MRTPPDTCAAARHANLALAIIAGMLCVLPCLGLLLNALAPVHLVPTDPTRDRPGWHWVWPATTAGTAETTWETRWKKPDRSLEEVLLPQWLWSQVRGKDQIIDKRNLPMRFAPEPTANLSGGRPLRPGVKTVMADFIGKRFGARSTLMSLGAWLKVDALGVTASSRVLLGADGWLFYNAGPAMIDDLRGINPFTPAQLEALITTFRRNRDHLARRGIRYLIVLCPSKARIYPELLPGWIRDAGGATRYDQVLSALAATDLDHLDLTTAVRAAREPAWQERIHQALADGTTGELAVYQRTDTHWNDLAVFPAYQALARELRNRYFPSLAPLTLDAMRVARARATTAGDLAVFLYQQQDPAWHERLIEIVPEDLPGMIDEGNIDPLIDTGTGRNDQPRALVFRDSFCQRLIPYLSQHFGLVRYRWTHRLLVRQKVTVVTMPAWLPGNERAVFRALRRAGYGGGVLIERGDDPTWSWADEPRDFSMDLDIAWLQCRDDRPDIVIQQFGERTLVETPGAFVGRENFPTGDAP